MGKFDDQGFFGPNKFKKRDNHPTHTGLVNLSHETLKALLASYQDTGEAKLEIAGWRKTDKPDMISLKIQLPKEREGGDRGGRSSGRGEERSRGSYRRDDRDDDRGRSNTRSRDDDFPGDRVARSRGDDRDTRRRDPEDRDGRYSRDDYGDDRDL